MTESFYDVLGVAEDATTDEIETAYRERLKETHPDVSDDDDAGQATKTLIEARDVLVDEDERARYDRLGHDAYVGDGPSAATEAATEASERDGESDTRASDSGAGGGASQSRSRREQRASQRVRQERRRAREARQKRRQQAQQNSAKSDATASADATDAGTDRTTATGNRQAADRDRAAASTTGRPGAATDGTSATASGNTYSVREDVTTSTSHGPLLPQGEQLTLLAIFFALYPVLLFSALLPAFPSFVNVVLGACTLMTIIYLQSMPRVSLLVFGGWSGLSVVGLGVFGVGYLSAFGLVVLAATVLPFGFSVLTAAALRY